MEQEWLACRQPQKMLEFLRNKGSQRKLWLFAVACCRRFWHLLSDERSRQAVDLAERHFDNYPDRPCPEAIAGEAHAAAGELNHQAFHARRGTERHRAKALALAASAVAVVQQGAKWANPASQADLTAGTAASTIANAAKFTARSIGAAGRPAAKQERSRQCDLLRDLFGNPFRKVVIDPSWLARNIGTVGLLAQAIHEDRGFDRLPILGDALEEAGCTDVEILTHCRGPGAHVLGCWVVDLLLGKEGRERCGEEGSAASPLRVETVRNTTITIRRS